MPIASINPATGQTLKRFDPLAPADLASKIARAAEAYKSYRRTSFADRRKWMTRAAEILEAEKDRFAAIMTTEMGKPLQAAADEAAKCATGCRYYVENAERILAPEEIATNAKRSYVLHQPLGVILAIMPWNFPFWQVFRFAAPALMSGNVGLLKHASNVPQCALAIEDIILRAGFPEGVFQTLLIGSDQVQSVIEDARIVAVTLTGSEPTGRQVASTAGKQLKKTVLELGGSDPFIVMPSVGIAEAVSTAVRARTINNGQSCIAAKRFIVADAIYDEFEKLFVQGMAALRVGDPSDPATQVGPLATPQIVQDLEEQVNRAVSAGARLLTGGRRPDKPGNFYEPSVLADVSRDSPVFHEELFGPVAMLFRVPDLDAAIALANDTPFGLGASAWTNDPVEQERFAEELEAGLVFINGMVASDARLPFGGVKHSGYGRELGHYGVLEFVNTKTIWIGANLHASTE
ncbi:MAG: NAD-dependent succinate-semialdehyde dehydrogenase [Acidobacteriota bacterium]|nr:NAD-dependent succinate-semialdehyde dehydrogenase [Acidobacteriota bacterium]